MATLGYSSMSDKGVFSETPPSTLNNVERTLRDATENFKKTDEKLFDKLNKAWKKLAESRSFQTESAVEDIYTKRDENRKAYYDFLQRYGIAVDIGAGATWRDNLEIKNGRLIGQSH